MTSYTYEEKDLSTIKDVKMNVRYFFWAMSAFLCLYGYADAQNEWVANTKEQDQKAIQSLCGCYEVTFEYAETFSPEKEYEFHDRKKAGALEWILLDEETPDKMVIQHLLVINDSMIIKHWRQDWLYENTDFFHYIQDKNWKYGSVPKEQVRGKWTQKVYQVDDSPRYEGAATWVHVDGKHYWESETDAPLPRREYTKRDDYNVMRRQNRHQITEYGHVHEQDNKKIVRSASGDQVLVMEKGMNTYRKVEDSRCEPAAKWWKEHKVFWRDVRKVWTEVFEENKTLDFHTKVEDKFLWKRLFELGKEVKKRKKYNSEKIQQEIKEIIQTYLK